MKSSGFLLFLVLGGCFYPNERGRLLEAKVEKLSAAQESLAEELKQKEERLLAQVETRMSELQKALAGLDRSARQSNADEGAMLQKAIEDVAALRGQMETWQHRFSELESKLALLEADAQKRWAEASAQKPRAPPAPEPGPSPEPEPPSRPTTRKDFLELAQDKARAGELTQARQLFKEFLKKWEKDELAGDAHFGLGDTFFTEEKCREALFEYGKVIQEFPKSRSAPAAYLRSSTCFRSLKMNDEALLALEELVRVYPKSDAAKTARVELAKLRRTKGKK